MRRAALVLAAFLLPLWGGGPAWADPPPNFGQHVRQCAQVMGFGGDHNPGMHQGAAGWDGMTCHQP
jgi:hypothetical protein